LLCLPIRNGRCVSVSRAKGEATLTARAAGAVLRIGKQSKQAAAARATLTP